jgi:macrophage erythroblast attacher
LWLILFLGLQDLVDIDIFVDARKVVDALLKKDCSEALAWCAENKSKLKKGKVVVKGLV